MQKNESASFTCLTEGLYRGHRSPILVRISKVRRDSPWLGTVHFLLPLIGWPVARLGWQRPIFSTHLFLPLMRLPKFDALAFRFFC